MLTIMRRWQPTACRNLKPLYEGNMSINAKALAELSLEKVVNTGRSLGETSKYLPKSASSIWVKIIYSDIFDLYLSES